MQFNLSRSTRKDKKWMISDGTKTVHFGAFGYSDFTIHKDPKRMERYLARHKPREDWTRSGMDTAGFWSRWVLWNKPSLKSSIRDVEDRFNVKIFTK